jgi:hypothetical protein
MSTLAEIRALTGTVRPPGNHGNKPVEVIPGLWTATFADIETPEKLSAVAPSVTVVINAAAEACATGPGSYGDKVQVVRIENFLDDPNPRKAVSPQLHG